MATYPVLLFRVKTFSCGYDLAITFCLTYPSVLLAIRTTAFSFLYQNYMGLLITGFKSDSPNTLSSCVCCGTLFELSPPHLASARVHTAF